MHAQLELDHLLQDLSPHLDPEPLVFCTVSDEQLSELLPQCRCVFREREGTSVLLPQNLARQMHLEFDGVYCQLTLQVFSSLQAVGLTAAVAAELAQSGINANGVAARFHDHLLVPENRAEEALRLLRGIGNRMQYS